MIEVSRCPGLPPVGPLLSADGCQQSPGQFQRASFKVPTSTLSPLVSPVLGRDNRRADPNLCRRDNDERHAVNADTFRNVRGASKRVYLTDRDDGIRQRTLHPQQATEHWTPKHALRPRRCGLPHPSVPWYRITTPAGPREVLPVPKIEDTLRSDRRDDE